MPRLTLFALAIATLITITPLTLPASEDTTSTPPRLDEALAALADTIVDQAPVATSRRCAVLEFAGDSAQGPALGGRYGILGRWCSHELARLLRERLPELVSVVDEASLDKALAATSFAVADLYSTRLADLDRELGEPTLLVQGRLVCYEHETLAIDVELIQSQTTELTRLPRLTARLSPAQWGLLGHSATIVAPAGQSDVDPTDEQVMEQFARAESEPHPLAQAEFPLPVRIVVEGKRRQGVFKGNDLWVPVRKGETFQVDLENRLGRRIIMRLLVDGRNTLPERQRVEDASVFHLAPIAGLDDARCWVLEPRVSQRFRVPGYFDPTGAILRRFTINEVAGGASRSRYATQPGLITAAFYEAQRPLRWELEDDEELGRDPNKPTRLLAVVNIRLVDAEQMSELLRLAAR